MQGNRIHPRLTWLQTKFMTLGCLQSIDPSTAGDLTWHEVVTWNRTARVSVYDNEAAFDFATLSF